MASIAITTTPEQDAAIQYATSQYNATSGAPAVTPVQYAKQRIDQLFASIVERWKAETKVSKAEAYGRASATDQATVDAILAKYQ